MERPPDIPPKHFRIPEHVLAALKANDRPAPAWYSGTLIEESHRDIRMVPPPGVNPEQLKTVPQEPRQIRRPEGNVEDMLRRQ
jgi:hypothetical protein